MKFKTLVLSRFVLALIAVMTVSGTAMAAAVSCCPGICCGGAAGCC